MSDIKKVKMFFPEDKTYNKEVYKKGVHTIEDKPKGFINRWLKRGCRLAEDEKVTKPVKDNYSKMKVEELEALLKEKGIEYNKEEIKDKKGLIKLLKESDS